MNNRNPATVEVLVTAGVSAEEEQAIVDAFRALDVAARTRMVPTRRGLERLQWLVLATLPLHAFLSGLGSAAAEDLAQGLKRLVGRGLGASPSGAGAAGCRDPAAGRAGSRSATQAYQALVALDLSAFEQGPVHYDRQRGEWRSELDEWQQRQAEDSQPA